MNKNCGVYMIKTSSNTVYIGSSANPDTKICKKCEQEFDKSFFYKDSRGKDGLFARCKACHTEATRNWQKNNKDKVNSIAKKYRDSHKEEVAEVFSKWNSKNKEYRRQYKKQYRENNKEARSAYRKQYYRINREQEVKSNSKRRKKASFAVQQRWRISDHTDGLCYWCGIELSRNDVKTVLEHIMPISLGGPANDSNEVWACSDCNGSKHNKHPLFWIATLVSEGDQSVN